MLAYGGANPIFRGAVSSLYCTTSSGDQRWHFHSRKIMESGAPQTGFGFTGTSSYPASLPYTQEQKYSIILNSTGCVASTNELACLKNASLKSIRSGQTRIVCSFLPSFVVLLSLITWYSLKPASSRRLPLCTSYWWPHYSCYSFSSVSSWKVCSNSLHNRE